MLKGKQKKLDKNNNGRIDAEDFKLLKGSKKGMRMGGMMYADDGAFVDYYSNTPKVDKKNLDRAGKGVGELVERIMMPPAAAIRDTGKAYKEFKKMQKRKQNKKDVQQIEAKKGKMVRMKSGGMNSDRMTARDIEAATARLETSAIRNKYKISQLEKALRQNPKNTDRLTNKDIERASSAVGKRKGGMLKAKSGGLSDTMKKLREKAYDKSGKKYKGVGKFGKDEYMIQKKLPGMKKGKSVDTIKITPTVKGKPMKARPFSPSKFDSGVRSRDYKFDKK